MKKLSLAIIAAFMNLFGAFAQTEGDYKERSLSLEEVNFVTSYYSQDGNNAAVTGGVGSEQLTDFANQLDLRILKVDKKGRQHTFTGSIGIDHYTSASSDKIDPTTISSASSADTRVYPKLGWTVNNPNTGWSTGLNISSSTEFDYTSFGLGLHVAKASLDKNRELSLNLQAYFDTWRSIQPIELRPPGQKGEDGDDAYTPEPRNSYSASLTYAQVVNKRLQVALMVDGIYQQGQLATVFHRVYFNDGSLRSETLPGTRFKVPIGVRLSYFIGNYVILRGHYRFYNDNWGLTAHTMNIELPVKLSPFLTLSPYYRFNSQSGLKYFAPYGQHAPTDAFFTSDYDLSDFTSQFVGAGVRVHPENGVFGMKNFSALEIRYGHYMRSTGLSSNIITLGMNFK